MSTGPQRQHGSHSRHAHEHRLGRPRSRRADAAILDAALSHLRARGFAGLSMEQVAADAGVGKTTLYRRYRNRADLAAAALASVTADEFEHAPVPEGTRDALLDHLCRFERGTGQVGLYVIASLLGEQSDPELVELHREQVVRRGRARAIAILRRAQERGEVRADADLDTAMEMLIGSLFARRLAGGTDGNWPDTAVDTLMAGLGGAGRRGSLACRAVIKRSSIPALLAMTIAVAGCGGSGSSTTADIPAGPAPTAPPPPKASTNLKDTKSKPVIPKPSGSPPTKLVVRDIVQGKGKAAKAGDQLSMQYVGVTFADGQEFDSSWDKGTPFQFQLGKGMVIKGWDKGLVGIKPGGRRELIIPSGLGYGAQGQPPSIPPNATLVFIVDALSVSGK